jgi:hypothetical protein
MALAPTGCEWVRNQPSPYPRRADLGETLAAAVLHLSCVIVGESLTLSGHPGEWKQR